MRLKEVFGIAESEKPDHIGISTDFLNNDEKFTLAIALSDYDMERGGQADPWNEDDDVYTSKDFANYPGSKLSSKMSSSKFRGNPFRKIGQTVSRQELEIAIKSLEDVARKAREPQSSNKAAALAKKLKNVLGEGKLREVFRLSESVVLTDIEAETASAIKHLCISAFKPDDRDPWGADSEWDKEVPDTVKVMRKFPDDGQDAARVELTDIEATLLLRKAKELSVDSQSDAWWRMYAKRIVLILRAAGTKP